MPFLITILGLFVFFTALLLVPMQFGVHVLKTTTKNKLYIYVSLFGMLIRIPIHTKTEPKKEKKKKDKKTKKENALTFQLFRKNVDAFGELLEVSKNELLEMLSYVRKHLSCKEVDFRIAFGTGDAAKTGITTGAVWTSGTLLLKLIDSLIGIQNIHMDVYPDFEYKRFEISFKTILIMRPIHFIMIYKRVSETIKFIKAKISKLS